jgi:hypothetical protein
MSIMIEATQTVAPSAAGGVGEPEGRRVRGRYPAARLVEAATLIGRVWDGDRRARLQLEEALSTSDFGSLFGATLDRQLLAAYQAAPSVWQSFATRRVVRDFRPASFFDILGGQAILPEVGQLAEYPARDVDTAELTIKVGKRGARFALSWETMVNDDLDAFRDLPQRLAQAARNTEDHIAAGLVEVGGVPNPQFFKGNAVLTGNPVLSSESLEAALTELGKRKDADGNPIVTNGRVLMVGPALEMTARRIINASEIRVTDGDRTIVTGNTLSGAVTLVVNPWLTSATAWYVLPAPGGARPALAVAFLRGYETPEIRVKADTGSMVGGGQVAPTDGSFDIDDIQYRARHVLGGGTLLADAVIASTGA